MNFNEWLKEDKKQFLREALIGLLEMRLSFLEGRRDPEKLRSATVIRKPPPKTLFTGKETEEEIAEKKKWHALKMGHRPLWQGCPVTPLSAYADEIKTIQLFARANANNFAQVLLFSPLSANASFAKHWDNFSVVMMILLTEFPDKIKPKNKADAGKSPREILRDRISAFDHPKYGLGATISGWKYDTITYVWNNRQSLKQKLERIAATGDEAELIMAMQEIPGVAPVKAGFIAQLIFGVAGCLDIHNIDIYSKVFPELAPELDDELWEKRPSERGTRASVERYVDTLGKLKSRGIGTSELWDVWVDFVAHMYKVILDGTQGLYADLGPALNPQEKKYEPLRLTVPKLRMLGKKDKEIGIEDIVGVDAISGSPAGKGASRVHSIAAHEPAETLQNLSRKEKGENYQDYIDAVIRNPKLMGREPALLYYFRQALDTKTGVIDLDKLRAIIAKISDEGIKKRKAKEEQSKQKELFGET